MFALNEELDEIKPIECKNFDGGVFASFMEWQKKLYEALAIPNHKPLSVGDVIMIDGIRHTIEKGPFSEESFSR